MRGGTDVRFTFSTVGEGGLPQSGRVGICRPLASPGPIFHVRRKNVRHHAVDRRRHGAHGSAVAGHCMGDGECQRAPAPSGAMQWKDPTAPRLLSMCCEGHSRHPSPNASSLRRNGLNTPRPLCANSRKKRMSTAASSTGSFASEAEMAGANAGEAVA
jgi:hypothetical protein